MSILRPVLSLTLMLAVVLTSLGMAVGRGAMAADGQLCSATGYVRIVLAHDGLPLLDPAGEPVMLQAPVCPDCVMGGLAVDAAPDLGAQVKGPERELSATVFHTDAGTFWRIGGLGRGPPVSA